MKILLAFTGALMLLAASAQSQQPLVIVYPVEAIADSARLKKAEFDERYPGIDLSPYGLMDEGWYVIYTHELMMFAYGPIDEMDEARRQKALLEEIRLNAVLKNPKLSSSKIEIIRFDFDATPESLPPGATGPRASTSATR